MFDHSQLATLPHPVYRSTKKIVFESPSVTSSGFELQSYPVIPMSLASSLFAGL